MGVGAERTGRRWEPMGTFGAGRSGCRPMERRAEARPPRWRRQVAAAAPGAGKQPVRAWVPEAGERPGEERRAPDPPECGPRPRAATPTEGRGLGCRGGPRRTCSGPRRRHCERGGWREREGGCPRRRGPPRSGSVAPEGRGLRRRRGGVPMAAGSRVFLRAPLGA